MWVLSVFRFMIPWIGPIWGDIRHTQYMDYQHRDVFSYNKHSLVLLGSIPENQYEFHQLGSCYDMNLHGRYRAQGMIYNTWSPMAGQSFLAVDIPHGSDHGDSRHKSRDILFRLWVLSFHTQMLNRAIFVGFHSKKEYIYSLIRGWHMRHCACQPG
jgi:hypothetical protein